MMATKGTRPAASPAPPLPLLGRSEAELVAWAAEQGEPAYRGRQIAAWLYRRGAESFAAMTDLPLELRERLGQAAQVGRGRIAGRRSSSDGSHKLLLEYADGRRIETVVLPYADRTSVCISSQVGCPVGCVFCATATMGLVRNLTAGEMVDQVLAARTVASESGAPTLSHVVVMGMGEPLLNLGETVRALRLIRDEVGISLRHVTVSTAGYVPGIRRLAEERLPITLAISLHAPDDALRARLIPLGRKYPLAGLMEAVRQYAEKTGRRVTLEYLLMAGVNDSPEQAGQLARLITGAIFHVNLIPWNPASSSQPFRTPSPAAVRQFRAVLEARGVTVTERARRGRDIDAACGQLAVTTSQCSSGTSP